MPQKKTPPPGATDEGVLRKLGAYPSLKVNCSRRNEKGPIHDLENAPAAGAEPSKRLNVAGDPGRIVSQVAARIDAATKALAGDGFTEYLRAALQNGGEYAGNSSSPVP
jgi:hypothetical protein